MIETQELHKNFGNKVALSHLSLNIKPGERVALIGQNGCGKTTLLRCLLGHYNYQGKVLVFEKNPRLDRVAVLSRVAFVPQHPPALKSTVQEFTHMVSQLCGIEISQIIAKANALGLDIQECSNRPIKNLSGGMKQKLLIAAAFSRNPELLIMDEPAANLDPQARACFFEQLLQLPPSTTMLLSSHRVDELSGLVTRVLEMDAGKIAVDGFVSTGNHGIAPSLSEQLDCVITLNQVPEAVSKNLREWGFKSAKLNPERWEGSFNAADRFRFLAMVTRWSGLIKSLTMKPSSESNATLSHGDGESKRQ